jgi:hypothetical protein
MSCGGTTHENANAKCISNEVKVLNKMLKKGLNTQCVTVAVAQKEFHKLITEEKEKRGLERGSHTDQGEIEALARQRLTQRLEETAHAMLARPKLYKEDYEYPDNEEYEVTRQAGVLERKKLANRVRTAGDPTSSTETLDGLADDEYEAVRAAVAGNSITPAHLLAKLGKDESEDVLWEIAIRKDTPTGTIDALTKHRSKLISHQALVNPNASTTAVCTVAAQNESMDMRLVAREIIKKRYAEGTLGPVPPQP